MGNTNFDTHYVKKCCENKLDIVFRNGKEFNGWVCIDNKKIARITISKGRKSIPPGTYKSMAKQLKISTKQFDDLLECLFKKKGYEKIMEDYNR